MEGLKTLSIMMTTSPGPHTPSTAWFLIACDGDLVLKLAHTLMIGEDARGETLISPDRDDALLSLTLTDSGRIVMQALAMEWTFSESGEASVQHLTLEEGQTVRLNFPNSTLLISHDIVPRARAVPDREIRLIPTDNPSITLTRLAPVTLDDDELESTAAADADADAIDEATFAASAAAASADPLLRVQSDIPDETLTGEHDMALLSPAALIDEAAVGVAPTTTQTSVVAAEASSGAEDRAVPPLESRATEIAAEVAAETAVEREELTATEQTSATQPKENGAAAALAEAAEFAPAPAADSAPPITTGELQAVVSASVPLEEIPRRRWQTPRRALAAAIALAALIAPAFLYFGSADAPGFAFLRSHYLPLDQAAPADWPEEAENVATARLAMVGEENLVTSAAVPAAGPAPVPGAEITAAQAAPTPAAVNAVVDTDTAAVRAETAAADRAATATATAETVALDPAAADTTAALSASRPVLGVPPIPTPLAQPARSEAENYLIASLLAEARALYDAGDIVSPVQANAVDRLTQVLNLDRTNETGLRLMYLCAMKLIEQAQTAYDAGDHYLARNLVEDVLGFHPELEDARTLLDDWRSQEIVSRGPNG